LVRTSTLRGDAPAVFHGYHHDPATGVGLGEARFTFVVEVHLVDRTVRCEHDEECVAGAWVVQRHRRAVAHANERWEVLFHGADPIQVASGQAGRTIRRLYEDAKPLALPYERRTADAAELCAGDGDDE
jgi:hypothetical protein